MRILLIKNIEPVGGGGFPGGFGGRRRLRCARCLQTQLAQAIGVISIHGFQDAKRQGVHGILILLQKSRHLAVCRRRRRC